MSCREGVWHGSGTHALQLVRLQQGLKLHIPGISFLYALQVWVNPVCTGAPGQLWRTVSGAGRAPGGGVFLVSRQQGFCLNRCEGGGCGYRGNAVGLATCLQGSGDQAFAFNGSQIEFSGGGECLTACRPGSQEDGCANGGSNMITPRNAEALACGGLRSQQWYIQ